jgi:hypothetical protein
MKKNIERQPSTLGRRSFIKSTRDPVAGTLKLMEDVVAALA